MNKQSWADNLKKRIQMFSEMEENWNGYGAKKINDSVIKKATEFVYFLIQNDFIIHDIFSNGYDPEVFPTANNSIQFEFEPSENKYFEVEIFDNKYGIYFYDDDTNKDGVEFDVKTLHEVKEKLQEFIKNLY